MIRALDAIRYSVCGVSLEKKMTDTNLGNPISSESVSLVPDSTKSEFVDKSVHKVGPPQLSDLWHNFSLLPNFWPLFKVLVWRSVTLRYSQSFLGVLWVAIQPISSTIMVFFVFSIIKVNTAAFFVELLAQNIHPLVGGVDPYLRVLDSQFTP